MARRSGIRCPAKKRSSCTVALTGSSGSRCVHSPDRQRTAGDMRSPPSLSPSAGTGGGTCGRCFPLRKGGSPPGGRACRDHVPRTRRTEAAPRSATRGTSERERLPAPRADCSLAVVVLPARRSIRGEIEPRRSQVCSTPPHRFALCTRGNGFGEVSVVWPRLGSMTSTATTPRDLRDLGPGDALAYVAGCRRDADREEAHLLAGVGHFIDLHPVTDQSQAATPRSRTRFLHDANDGQGLVEPPLGGPGTPGVAEFAVEELAAALGVSYPTGLQLAIEAVELCYRLPRLWALVQQGLLQAWKARQVARATTGLSPAAVAFVDAHVAVTGRHNKTPAPGAVVHEARLQCDPDQAAGVEQAALDARGVWLDHRESTATTQLNARLDTLDALDLDHAVTDLATTLGDLGDARPLDIRRATALGLLANPQRALDLFAHRTPTLPGTNPAGSGPGLPGTDLAAGDPAGPTMPAVATVTA